MKLRSRLGLAALLSALATASPAALLTTHYAHVSGTSWTVDLALTNDDGTPPAIEAVTAYFDEAWFANLQLLASPAGWDTIAVQPSTTIPAAGFIDALVMDPPDALGLGDQAGGFRVQFDFLGSDAPGALAFDVHDPITTRSGRMKSPIAEPSRRNSGFEATSNETFFFRFLRMRSRIFAPVPTGTVLF